MRNLILKIIAGSMEDILLSAGVSADKLQETIVKLEDMRQQDYLEKDCQDSLLKILRHEVSDIQDLLKMTLVESLRLTNSKLGVFIIYNEATDSFSMTSFPSGSVNKCSFFQLPESSQITKGGLWEKIASEKKSIKENDFSKSGLTLPENHLPINRYIATPIFVKEKLVAIGLVANKETNYLSADRKKLELLLESAWGIIEQKKVEADNKKWANVFENAEWGMLINSADSTTLELINPALAKMHGYTVEELQGMPITTLLAEDSVSALTKNIKRAHEDGNHSYEAIHRRKNGKPFPVLINVTAVKNNAGKVLYRVVNVQDITIQKNMEKALSTAKELAESTNKAKSDFLAFTLHELSTPLNAITSLINLLDDSKAEPNQQEIIYSYLMDIQNNTEYLMTLINELQDLGKIESGNLDINPKSFLLDEYLGGIIKMFQRNRTNFEYKTEGELGMINTDPLRLQQIINNLLSNAMKYTPPEKAIGLYVKPAGDNLEIKIWDTGFGISPENQAKLFTPYFRIKNEQTRNIMGTGLGLTLTKKLAELLGITISLESTLNEGTVFTLTISNRTNQENEENEKNKTTNELPFLKEALRNHSFKTLIVEDNATSIGILTAIFKNIGKQTTAEIVFARDSSEALELAKNNNFSLIISDINFGYGLNGYELLNELKKISYPEANAPIIIAHSATNDPNKYLAAGFNAFLPKAILPVDFYKTLHRLLIENK